MPPEIDFGFWIHEEVLRAQDLPVEEIPLAELENNMDICYLEKLGTDDRNLSPRMLIENFETETKHAQKVNNADIQYPIEIYEFRNKRVILDGVHRYTKIVMSGAETIRVRRVTEEVLPLVKKTDEEFRRWKGEMV